MAHQDDGFHEIQLNGKQLVFLFMAATVVSVVIFLCGVLVGRGVRGERGGVADTVAVSSAGDATPQPAAAAPAPAPAGSDPTTAAAPPPPADDLTYFNRLEKKAPPSEQLKGAPKAEHPAAAPAAAPKVAERPAAQQPKPAERAPAQEPRAAAAPPPAPKEPPRPAAAPAPPAPAANAADPGGQGFAVQIAALNVRSEADAIAKRLNSKGYAAYVMTPADGTPSVYRVRVGKFPTRREAETIAAKLQREEQLKPWVTR